MSKKAAEVVAVAYDAIANIYVASVTDAPPEAQLNMVSRKIYAGAECSASAR